MSPSHEQPAEPRSTPVIPFEGTEREILKEASPYTLSSFGGLCDRLGRPGSDLLSRVLRHSTIGAGGLNDRVRNGIGWGTPARTTRSTKPTAIHNNLIQSEMIIEFEPEFSEELSDKNFMGDMLVATHGFERVYQAYRAISTGKLCPRGLYTPGLST